MEENIDDTFEIRDGDINVEDIERQIKENIIERKKLGTYSKDVEDIIKQPLLQPADISYRCGRMSDINYMNSNWDVQNVEYKISSHRPIIGRLLIWGRKLVHGEVKRHVDLIIGRQSEFNKRIVSTLNEIDNKINEIDNKINEIDNTNNVCSDNKICDSINYFVFNESFGGSNEEIRTNAEQFLDFFLECKNVLDIGCGRGIFLELLKEKGIKGYGIDTDSDFILYCNRKNLNVQKDDAIAHLKKLNDKILDGIFISHLIEHLKYEDIVYLLKLCYEKMQYGSHIVIATPNILNMTVSSNTFYTDPTHTTHVHPEFIKFLLKIYGFRDIQEKFYQPTSKDQMLKKIDNIDNLDDEQKKICDIMNHNIEILNNLLFVYRDYAIIAKK